MAARVLICKTAGKTPASQGEAAIRKKLTVYGGKGPEEIKAFLASHEPEALEISLDEKWQAKTPDRDAVFEKLKRKYGICKFKLEGAKFSVLNVKSALAKFERNFRDYLKKPSKAPRPRKPGYTLGPGVRYYQPYSPRNTGLQDLDCRSGKWLTDKSLAIKADPLSGRDYQKVGVDVGKFVKKEHSANEWRTARIKGLTLYVEHEYDPGIPCVHIQSNRTHYLYNARYLDMVFTQYPEADLLLSENGCLLFIDDGPVAIAMPLREAGNAKKGSYQALPESVREVILKPQSRKHT